MHVLPAQIYTDSSIFILLNSIIANSVELNAAWFLFSPYSGSRRYLLYVSDSHGVTNLDFPLGKWQRAYISTVLCPRGPSSSGV